MVVIDTNEYEYEMEIMDAKSKEPENDVKVRNRL